MSIAQQPMSVQQAYKLFRDGSLLVNRQYQRKLVWATDEKASLIESILRGYPIPLFLFARITDGPTSDTLEIIDGVQRLNAIFGFIENEFDVNGTVFDVIQNARAKQAADDGLFILAGADKNRLGREASAAFLEYQLPATIFTAPSTDHVNEVFRRINSGGKHLSDQERRQAGVLYPFANLIRELAAELRGDVSQDVVDLRDMPEISIESRRGIQGYGLQAEETFWCKQGILRVSQLRESEDEQMLADLAASIILGKPIPFSGDLLDSYYQEGTDDFDRLQSALTVYSSDSLKSDLKQVWSILVDTVHAVSGDTNFLRQRLNPAAGSNPIKTPFYALFMAFYQLIVTENKLPVDANGILNSLNDLSSRLQAGRRYSSTEQRENNIAVTKGLVERYFAAAPSPGLGHGPALTIDFVNALRRSQIETPRYELKQGLLELNGTRPLNVGLLDRLLEHICGIANSSNSADGYVFIGVADKQADAERIRALDGVSPATVGQRFVVGVDRECKLLNESVEDYLQRIVLKIRNSNLTDPLKTQVLSQIDLITYSGFSVIRIRIPVQLSMSFLGEKAYTRKGSNTEEAVGPEILSISALFASR